MSGCSQSGGGVLGNERLVLDGAGVGMRVVRRRDASSIQLVPEGCRHFPGPGSTRRVLPTSSASPIDDQAINVHVRQLRLSALVKQG